MFVSSTQTVFYSIEKAIKTYRKFAQKRLTEVVPDITLDQAILLLLIEAQPDGSQRDLAVQLFKDDASMTRMVDLLVKNGFITRQKHDSDKRRTLLAISAKGKHTLKSLRPVIAGNRLQALQGLDKHHISTVQEVLNRISANCHQGMTGSEAT